MALVNGKVTVITDAGAGMGKDSTMVFVREGAQVVAADLSGAEKRTAAEMRGAVVPIHCDATTFNAAPTRPTSMAVSNMAATSASRA